MTRTERLEEIRKARESLVRFNDHMAMALSGLADHTPLCTKSLDGLIKLAELMIELEERDRRSRH